MNMTDLDKITNFSFYMRLATRLKEDDKVELGISFIQQEDVSIIELSNEKANKTLKMYIAVNGAGVCNVPKEDFDDFLASFGAIQNLSRTFLFSTENILYKDNYKITFQV